MVRTGIRTHGPYYLLQNSIHKRNVVEDQPQKLSPLLNLKPHLKPQHSPTLQIHRCLPRMWSLEVKWRICHLMCTLGVQYITCRCCRSYSPRLLTAFVLAQNPPLKQLLRQRRSSVRDSKPLSSQEPPWPSHCSSDRARRGALATNGPS